MLLNSKLKQLLLLFSIFVFNFLDYAELSVLRTNELFVANNTTGTCSAEDGLFQCHNFDCIPASKVCDGIEDDCLDGSDEWDDCQFSCSTLNCDHGCVPRKERDELAICYCKPGYQISGSRKNRCKDINECKTWGSCSQSCENYDGSFACSCQAGFRLERNNKTCLPEDPNVRIVYALKNSIHVYNMEDNSNYSITNDYSRQTVAVAVDVRNQKVLWTGKSSKGEAIYRSDIFSGSGIDETVVDIGIGAIDGLAYDWITGNIYFTDQNKGHVVACTNDGTHCTVLVKMNKTMPREIVLQPNEGIMFWTNWGLESSICRSQMNGQNPHSIVSSNLKKPTGLALDHYGTSRLYWSDSESHTIETVDFNGNDRRLVHSAKFGYHFSLDIFDETLFWGDWEVNSIQSCNKFNGSGEPKIVVQEKSSEGRRQPNGISIFHPTVQPKSRENQCENGECSHICLLAERNEYSCACPSGMVLSKSKKNCKDDDKTAKIVVGHANQLLIYKYGSIGRKVLDRFSLEEKAQIEAVHYNQINQTVFVGDNFRHVIYEFDPKTNESTAIVTESIDTVSGISFDMIGQNLYWTDSSKRTIEVMSLKTRTRATIVNFAAEKDCPQDLIVVLEKKAIFVILTHARYGRIMKYSLDGLSQSTVAKMSGEPTSLTYNRELDRLYWCDTYRETIEYISLDHPSNPTIFQTNDASSIGSFGSHLFWTDHRTRLLNSIEVAGTDLSDLPEQLVFIGRAEDRYNLTGSSMTDGYFDAKISILQKDLKMHDELMRNHECSLTRSGGAIKKCSHICLISEADNIGTCTCPQGMELGSDSETCKIKCPNHTFQCSDDRCIPTNWRCDRYKDCSDGGDEVDCTSFRISTCHPFDTKCSTLESDANDWPNSEQKRVSRASTKELQAAQQNLKIFTTTVTSTSTVTTIASPSSNNSPTTTFANDDQEILEKIAYLQSLLISSKERSQSSQ